MSAIDYDKESTKRLNWLDLTGGTEVTLLDYFAGKAMEALVGSNTVVNDTNVFAEAAYEMAEAMLAERNKRFTPQNVVRGVTGKTYG